MVTNTECVTNGTQELNRTEENATCNQLQQQDAHINALLVPAEARICLICFYVTIFLLGVTGNAVVCWVIGEEFIILYMILCTYLYDFYFLARV